MLPAGGHQRLGTRLGPAGARAGDMTIQGQLPGRRCRNARSGAGEGGEVPAGEGGGPYQGGRPAVNVKVPIGVVKWGMKMAQAFSPQMRDVSLDWNSLDAMVQEGETGEIVEVEDEAGHKTIEVWLE